MQSYPITISDDFKFCTLIDEEALKSLSAIITEIENDLKALAKDTIKKENLSFYKETDIEKIKFGYEIKLKNKQTHKVRSLLDILNFPNEKNETITEIECRLSEVISQINIVIFYDINPLFGWGFKYRLTAEEPYFSSLDKKIKAYALKTKQPFSFLRRIPLKTINLFSLLIFGILAYAISEGQSLEEETKEILKVVAKPILFIGSLAWVLSVIFPFLFPRNFIAIGGGKHKLTVIKFLRWLLGLGGLGGIIVSIFLGEAMF